MLLRLSALTAVLAASALIPAAAQSGTFDLVSGAKAIGRDSYSISKAKQGYKLTSRLSYHINGIETELSDEFQFNDGWTYLQGSASSISTQMHTSYVPDKSRTDLTIGMVQGGVQDSHHLSIKPDFVLMPPFDAGAAQVMLLLAVTHPTEKNLYNIVVPGGAPAAGPAQDPSDPGAQQHQAPGNNAYDALFSKGSDAAGTLDGKPVTLHTYTLTSGKFTWTFFADDANLLMELDNSMAHASYIRQKFKLAPPQ